jgi:hypothetical protein
MAQRWSPEWVYGKAVEIRLMRGPIEIRWRQAIRTVFFNARYLPRRAIALLMGRFANLAKSHP